MRRWAGEWSGPASIRHQGTDSWESSISPYGPYEQQPQTSEKFIQWKNSKVDMDRMDRFRGNWLRRAPNTLRCVSVGGRKERTGELRDAPKLGDRKQ